MVALRSHDHFVELGIFAPSAATARAPASTVEASGRLWRGQRRGSFAHKRIVADEAPVALTYNGSTYAVMMATPQDLEDFAIGFSLTEGLVESIEQIRDLEISVLDEGIDLRVWLAADAATHLAQHRRQLTGPTGCGLCGADSLSRAVRPALPVRSTASFEPAAVLEAMQALRPLQTLHEKTRATHAAGLWVPQRGLVCAREDVGRHNALDKLAGALVQRGIDAAGGLVVLTSRLSVEMVQKVSVVGAPVVASISAPTGLAIRMADSAGITVAAVVRDDGFEVFSHPERLGDAGTPGRAFQFTSAAS